MINPKLEEAESSNYAESESVPETEDSVFSENRARLVESKKKLKKVRSIRLLRISSITRRVKPQHEKILSILSSNCTESSKGSSSPVEISDSSSPPHYMKGTSSSHAKESFQKSDEEGIFTKKSLKLKRKLKSSRSIKIGTFRSPKSTKNEFESINGSDNKSQRVFTRKLSLKPVRILAKSSQSPESSLHRSTCSSALKGSDFPDHIELPEEEGSGSQGVPAAKVCPYTYCSLHGRHRRDDLPPLKRFVSMRRRLLKTQKSVKMDDKPVSRSKQSGNTRKVTQNAKKSAKDSSIRPRDTKGSAFSEGGNSSGDGEGKCNLRYDTDMLSGERSYPDVVNSEESASIDVVKSSAFNVGILEEELAAGGKITEGDYGAMQMSSVRKDAEPACTTDVSYRMQERDDKYMKTWNVVYKHAVLSDTRRDENKLPFDGNRKEGGAKDANSFDGVNSETDQDVDDENKSVIELVQKAFDEILLPEPEDLASGDDLESRGIGSDEEQKSEDKRGEDGHISASRESSKEETGPKDDDSRSRAEVVITAQRTVSKPDQKAPKSWSNLKKIILLRRFVKALEKVRNLNFRRPRHLPLDGDFESEKVFLKRQTSEEKRSAEEWMLDYALQTVVSKLAPAQRQRVALLVEAFETIRPFKDAQNGQLSSAAKETLANQIRPLDDSSDHGKEETDKDNANDNPLPEMHNPGAAEEELNAKQSLARSYDNGEKALNGNDNVYLAEIKDSRSRSLSKPVEVISSCHEEAPTDGTVNEVPGDLISNPDTGKRTSKADSPGRDLEAMNLVGGSGEQFSVSRSLILKGLARSLGSNLVGSGQASDLVDEPTVERTEKIEQSEAPMSSIIEPETQPEKQNYTGLWYMVYKHMVSDSAENDSKSTIDGEEEKESGCEGGGTRETSVSYEGTPATNQDMDFKDNGIADPEVALRKIEAIKMVEEAIDSIIPDDQDHTPERHLLANYTFSDNSNSKQSERTHSKGQNQKEDKMASGNGITEEKQEETATKEGNNPTQKLPRSWSNLRKVILLRRFIKALEKVRKFNPRGPRYLPVDPDPESEKVNLRHQDTEDRKGTEEWMLDYALRQVVSKLTPARKRKVELLVEAFETVIPTIKS